ncbi:hypothetical protein Pcinc_004672 [Petrolisthes cinctipes]|uniref:Uncharacterized protein n=1 Tax=Petrolisthes cinctipes TaxID=88211 RepID=A0AAE1KZW0_PETCI|nr:hypothetical protein Pcinc_004672 [Petrolisthes cinctipes]
MLTMQALGPSLSFERLIIPLRSPHNPPEPRVRHLGVASTGPQAVFLGGRSHVHGAFIRRLFSFCLLCSAPPLIIRTTGSLSMTGHRSSCMRDGSGLRQGSSTSERQHSHTQIWKDWLSFLPSCASCDLQPRQAGTSGARLPKPSHVVSYLSKVE